MDSGTCRKSTTAEFQSEIEKMMLESDCSPCSPSFSSLKCQPKCQRSSQSDLLSGLKDLRDQMANAKRTHVISPRSTVPHCRSPKSQVSFSACTSSPSCLPSHCTDTIEYQEAQRVHSKRKCELRNLRQYIQDQNHITRDQKREIENLREQQMKYEDTICAKEGEMEEMKSMLQRMCVDNEHLQRGIEEGREKFAIQDKEYRDMKRKLEILDEGMQQRLNQVIKQNECLRKESKVNAVEQQRLKRELEKSKRDMQRMQSKFEKKHDAEKDAELQRIQILFLKLKDETKDFSAHIDAQNGEIEKLRCEKSELLARVDSLQCNAHQMDRLKEQLSDLKSEHKEVIDNKDGEIKNLKEQLCKLKGDLCRLYDEHRTLMEGKEREIKVIQSEEDKLQQELDRKEREWKRLECQFKQQRQCEIQQSEQELQEVARKCQELEKMMDGAKMENEDLKSEICGFQQQIKQKDQGIQRLKARLHELERANEAREAKLAELQCQKKQNEELQMMMDQEIETLVCTIRNRPLGSGESCGSKEVCCTGGDRIVISPESERKLLSDLSANCQTGCSFLANIEVSH